MERKNPFVRLDDLIHIKGIGRETLSDIKGTYENIDELIFALKNNKHIPLRNDIVKKLKNNLMED